MTVTQFHRAASAALATQQPDKIILLNLLKQAEQLADMVGWANGIIDQDGRVSEAFIKLQAQARARHAASGDQNVARLHDALGNLLGAILQHDQDLTPSSHDDDNSVDR